MDHAPIETLYLSISKLFFTTRATVAFPTYTNTHTHTQRTCKRAHIHTQPHSTPLPQAVWLQDDTSSQSISHMPSRTVPTLPAASACLTFAKPTTLLAASPVRPPLSLLSSFLLPLLTLLFLIFSQGLWFRQLWPSWLLSLWKTSATRGGLE